jgi:hypothetical protein
MKTNTTLLLIIVLLIAVLALVVFRTADNEVCWEIANQYTYETVELCASVRIQNGELDIAWAAEDVHEYQIVRIR